MKKINKLASLLMLLIYIFLLCPQAMANDYGTNIALDKPIVGIVYSSDFKLENTNDGDKSTNAAARGEFAIDLQDVYNIDRIILWSRTDLDAEWARSNISIKVGMKSDFSDAVEVTKKVSPGSFGSEHNAVFDPPIKGRYIVLPGSTGIADVEVYGSPVGNAANQIFNDLETVTQKNAVNVVTALDIMSASADTEFGADYLVSRGQAAKMMAQIAGVGEPTGYNGEFSDVSADSEYASYISAGVARGYISRSDIFRPDEYVTYVELSKMLLCINGYYSFGYPSEYYPDGIMADASKIGLYDGVKGDRNGYVGKIDMAVMIYNILINGRYSVDGDNIQKSKETYMELELEKSLLSGVITNNGVTGFAQANTNINISVVEINGVQYADPSGLATDFFGENIYFIINEDNQIISVWRNDKKNNVVEFSDYEITDASLSGFEVEYADGSREKYRMETPPYTFLNGVAYAGIGADDLVPKNGYVKLIDNDGDGLYELLMIYKPEIIEAENVLFDEDTGDLKIKTNDSQTKEYYGMNYIYVYNTSGTILKASHILSGSVLRIYEASNGSLTVEIMNSAASGKVTAVSGNSISIDSSEYMLSDYFASDFSVNVGTTGRFILDKNDIVIYTTAENDGLKQGEYLGIVTKAALYMDETFLEVYTSNKDFETVYFADSFLFNGNRIDVLDFIERYSSEDFLSKLILFKTNSEGKIVSIDKEGYGVTREEIVESSILPETTKASYGYYSENTIVALSGDDVPTFVIPVDTSNKPLRENAYLRLYNYTTFDKLYGNRDKTATDSSTTLYGMDERKIPSVVVRRIQYSTEDSDFGTVTGYLNINLMVFESAIKNVDEYGDEYYTIKGTDCVTGEKLSVDIEPGITKAVNTQAIQEEGDSSKFTSLKLINKWIVDRDELIDITELQYGDILRYAYGSYENASQLEMICNNTDWTTPDNDVNYKIVYTAGDQYMNILSTVRWIQTKVVSAKEGYITFMLNGENQTYKLDNFAGKVIVVDESGERSLVTSYNPGDASIYLQEGDRIAIYTNAGSYKCLVVYK